MRRPSGIFLACVLMVLTASLASAQAPATTQPAQPAAPPLNFTGDVVLWAFAINPEPLLDVVVGGLRCHTNLGAPAVTPDPSTPGACGENVVKVLCVREIRVAEGGWTAGSSLDSR